MNGSIKTERLLLRKYTEADRDASVRLSLDKDVMHFMGGEHAETEEEANMIFDKCLEVYGGSLNGKPLGSRRFELKQTPNTNGNELEIVYLLDKEYWGRGLMPEAIKAVNQYANSTGTQVIGTINPENIRTVRSLEKAGIEKQEWIGKGENRVYKVWLKTR
jgi:ribosomal-protein-alanine N-acetyltransferase